MTIDNYATPAFLTARAKELNDKFYLILNNIVENYPKQRLLDDADEATATNPDVLKYRDGISKMTTLQNEYFLYKNDILKESESLSSYGKGLDVKINEYEEKNKNIRTKLSAIKASSNSAVGMLDDTQLTRNQLYVGDIILFLLTVMGGYVLYKINTNSSQIVNKPTN